MEGVSYYRSTPHSSLKKERADCSWKKGKSFPFPSLSMILIVL
ncbi:hypothetical protein KNP414_01352 [Paenibacillus mucilaginosus KNP414]|uniref:Uncharacterized protein n=1 Tax=Paenibacillus mucilaginosus (strain KNP414) TaxID=1036673 RepID=F8FJF3_PAEMK|nr:hypothetical protein KNP414_01352 [Paenibacillus mucilaginosus KNP414]